MSGPEKVARHIGIIIACFAARKAIRPTDWLNTGFKYTIPSTILTRPIPNETIDIATANFKPRHRLHEAISANVIATMAFAASDQILAFAASVCQAGNTVPARKSRRTKAAHVRTAARSAGGSFMTSFLQGVLRNR